MAEDNCSDPPQADDEVEKETRDGPSTERLAQLSADAEKAEGNPPDNSYVVDWDGAQDPQNPQNWGSRKKWTIIILISAVAFNQAMSATIFAPGVPQAMREFDSDNQAVASLLISIYVIGLAIGPLFLMSLSELYGRTPLMHATNFTFLVASVLCAVSVKIPMLLVFRLVMGVSTLSLGGGYVADMMNSETRGRAMNVWTVGPVLAPVIGPTAGGFISLRSSWRWTFGLVAIIGAVSIVACFALLPETYPPRLLELKARRLRKETANSLWRSKYHKDQTHGQLILLSIMRPMKMLLCSPIVGIVSLFLAIAYSYIYVMFTTFTYVFETTYGFNAGEAGLTYLGLGVGALIGQYTLDHFMKRYLKKQLAKNDKLCPENQLPPLIVAGLLLSFGLFWYGWSMEYKVHWIVPIIGTSLCGAGFILCFVAVQTYLVETYSIYAASALAASTLVRCIFGLTLPLAGPELYNKLGLGWGNSLLGFLAAAVAPAALWLLKHGESIRSNPKFMPEL